MSPSFPINLTSSPSLDCSMPENTILSIENLSLPSYIICFCPYKKKCFKTGTAYMQKQPCPHYIPPQRSNKRFVRQPLKFNHLCCRVQREVVTCDNPNRCCQCDYAISQASFLRAHLKMHSGEKSNKCNQCAKVYSFMPGVKRGVVTCEKLNARLLHSSFNGLNLSESKNVFDETN